MTSNDQVQIKLIQCITSLVSQKIIYDFDFININFIIVIKALPVFKHVLKKLKECDAT